MAIETCQTNCGNTFLVKLSVDSTHFRLSPSSKPIRPNVDAQIAFADGSDAGKALTPFNTPRLPAAATMSLTSAVVLKKTHAISKPTGNSCSSNPLAA